MLTWLLFFSTTGMLLTTGLVIYLAVPIALAIGCSVGVALLGYVISGWERQLPRTVGGLLLLVSTLLVAGWGLVPLWPFVDFTALQRAGLFFMLAYSFVHGMAVDTIRNHLRRARGQSPTRRIAQEHGATLQLMALFMLMVGLPLSIIAGDLTRYVYVRSVLQRSADAAAEAAAQQADIWHFQNTGEVRFNAAAAVDAARVGYANSSPLLERAVYPSIDYIGLDEHANQARVHMSARLRPFIIGAPDVRVVVQGTAALRMRRE